MRPSSSHRSAPFRWWCWRQTRKQHDRRRPPNPIRRTGAERTRSHRCRGIPHVWCCPGPCGDFLPDDRFQGERMSGSERKPNSRACRIEACVKARPGITAKLVSSITGIGLRHVYQTINSLVGKHRIHPSGNDSAGSRIYSFGPPPPPETEKPPGVAGPRVPYSRESYRQPACTAHIARPGCEQNRNIPSRRGDELVQHRGPIAMCVGSLREKGQLAKD